jgi:HD-GYP domain-containing protein (c-di-GMP phosphodiesterase class II)
MSRRRLETHLTLVFGITALLVLLGIVLFVNNRTVSIVDRASQTLFSHMAAESGAAVDKSLASVDVLSTLLISDPQAVAYHDAALPSFTERMRVVLDAMPVVSAIYIGFDNGGFVLLRRLSSSVARRNLAAPDNARYLLERIAPELGDTPSRVGAASAAATLTFLDDGLHTIRVSEPLSLLYDPRARDWYRQARAQTAPILTGPYWFYATEERGITYAQRLRHGGGVVGIDLGLADLSSQLQKLRNTPGTALLIVDNDGDVLASTDDALMRARHGGDRQVDPLGDTEAGGAGLAAIGASGAVAADAATLQMDAAAQAFKVVTATQPDTANVGTTVSPIMRQMMRAAHDKGFPNRPVRLQLGNGFWTMRAMPVRASGWTFRVVLATPDDEVLTGARRLVVYLEAISLLGVLVMLLVIRLTARRVSRPLVAISKQAEALNAFDFPGAMREQPSSVAEIATLSGALHRAGSTLQRFVEIGRTLAAERDPDRLLARLLDETVNATRAEGGVILLTEDDGVHFRIGARAGSRSNAKGTYDAPDGPMRLATTIAHAFGTEGVVVDTCAGGLGERIRDALQRHAATQLDWPIRGARVGVPTADASRLLSDEEDDDPLLAALTGDPASTANASEGAVPASRLQVIALRNRSNELIGGLLLCMGADEAAQAGGKRARTAPGEVDLARALAGNAAIALETALLLKSRKALLDGVVRMIAEATDAKSPHTSGHCQRVPVLMQGLVQAACDSKAGPYAHFALTPDDWEAVDVASWLHDCGKLTTPEYVIDKATKLETLTNRIHEIRTRFEVLKAHAHIDYWRAVANGESESHAGVVRDRTLTVLDDEFAFVASCNEGSEFTRPEDIARLKSIGERRWTRTLDDTLGTSRDEQARMARSRQRNGRGIALPVEERLLADREDHVISHEANALSDREARFGFSMRPLASRNNMGELYNLSIARGTLTPEERFEINRHITRTIVMLEGLPLTGALKRVPEYAGGHHEKMDGGGYPRGLTRNQMSPIARMMAIADVFEALTAGDRPYKKAKPLSEAFRIMGQMKRDNHLDPDLLDLFVSSGVWRAYATQFLLPWQSDNPDVDAILAITPSDNDQTLMPA